MLGDSVMAARGLECSGASLLGTPGDGNEKRARMALRLIPGLPVFSVHPGQVLAVAAIQPDAE